MTPLTQTELNTTLGGGFEWGEFLSTLSWVLGAGCATTGHLGVCGAALVVGRVNSFNFLGADE
jgi:hypothetical protein